MARRCDLCGKMSGAGNNVSHSKRRTRRVWRPNVQRSTFAVDGVMKQRLVCTRCIRTQRKVTV
ncbi:MAG TPA: 50S ribosomal protein L28 [Chloroflexota bacterium]|nr:50S ribosomal protein L28 [Chloroflexota bacterium]